MASRCHQHGPTVRLRDLPKPLLLRLALAFVERALNTMVIPLMAIYLSANLGPRRGGLLLLGSVVVTVIAGLSSGHAADVFGRRRALLAGAALMTIGFSGMAVAAMPSWSSPLTVFGFYLLQAAAASFIQPVHDTVIIDVTAPEQRKAAYTLNYWSFNIALAIGALLGGFLYRDHFVALLIGASACAFVATLVTQQFLAETAPCLRRPGDTAGNARGARWILGGYTLALRDRRFMALLLAMTLVLGLEMQRTSGYVALRLAESVPTQHLFPIGDSPVVTGIQLLGILQAVNTLGVALLALISQRILRRLDDRRSIVVGVGLFTFGCALLATSNVAIVLVLAVLILTVGELMHIPPMQAMLAGIVPDHARSKYMAVFNCNVRGGMVIASLSLSAATLVSPASMAALFVLLGVCAVALYRSAAAASSKSPARAVHRPRARSHTTRPHHDLIGSPK